MDMTRFLLSLDQAVDIIFDAIRHAKSGETYIPIVKSARMIDLAKALIGDRKNEIKVIGIRPGEKLHEILISEEEIFRSIRRDNYYVILPILPELRKGTPVEVPVLEREYSSLDDVLSMKELIQLLEKNNLMLPD